VPRIRPESAAEIASSPPANSIAVPKPTFIHGLYSDCLPFLHLFVEPVRFLSRLACSGSSR
jgi:hypothetical protein